MRAKTDKRKELERADLVKLLATCTLKEIAELYSTSIYMIHYVLKEQIKKKNTGFTVVEPTEVVDLSEGAWMSSKERVSYQQYKKVNNQLINN